MNHIPAWQLSIITVGILLSPMLALLMVIVVEVLIDSLLATGVPVLLAAVAGAIGWSLFHKLRLRPREQATVET